MSSPVWTQSDATASSLGKRPNRTLHRKMLLWMLIVAALPVGAAMGLFHFLVHRPLEASGHRDGLLLAQVVASSLSRRQGEWTRREGELLDSLANDDRMCFVFVTDATGKMVHVGVYHPEGWDQYTDKHPSVLTQRRLGDQDSLEHIGLMVVHKVPIMLASAPVAGAEARQSASETEAPQPVGHVVLAVRDQTMAAAAREYQLAMTITLCVVILIGVPLVRVMIRGWSEPMNALIEAIRRLAQGQQPEPITIVSNDELGYLAGAFNDMAARLIVGRKQLIKANETLEQKVQERTAALEEAVLKLDNMASTDPLTKLANRRAFDTAIERYFAESATYQRDLACIMIDLDGFKEVNDTLGHDKGDDLLVLTGRIVRESIPTGAFAARLGGDEFVLLLPETSESSARTVADGIQSRFVTETQRLLESEASPLRVSMSMGLASLSQTQAVSSAVLLSQADQALYRAKEQGKSCVVVYRSSDETLGPDHSTHEAA